MNELISVQDIVKAMHKKGHMVFENSLKPFNLNIVGIRAKDLTPNIFNDIVAIFWKYKGGWSIHKSIVTTDPGMHYLKDPLNKDGTAILKEGQYRGMWAKGLHQGKHVAFQQVKPCTVIRDNNKDGKFDFDGKEETGLFGINGHKANQTKESFQVDKWSAGCTVWANPHEHDIAMHLADMAIKYWAGNFTYTLINEGDL